MATLHRQLLSALLMLAGCVTDRPEHAACASDAACAARDDAAAASTSPDRGKDAAAAPDATLGSDAGTDAGMIERADAEPRDAGSGGTGGTGGMAALVACGRNVCTMPVDAPLQACCFDEFAALCGVRTTSGSCQRSVASDPRCPSAMLGPGVTLPSCCTTGNECGLAASMFGLPGCTELGEAARALAAKGLTVAVPSPRSCQ